MNNIKETYRNVVVQIATPYSTGTGFCLKGFGVIVTSDHIVRDNREVIIEGLSIPRQLVRVIFSDPKYDLALLELPHHIDIPEVHLSVEDKTKKDDKVLAISHPFGLKYEAIEGTIEDPHFFQEDLDFIKHATIIHHANGGGPLVNDEGDVVGINTYASWDDEHEGLSIPVQHLIDMLHAFQSGGGDIGARCFSCGKVCFEYQMDDPLCPSCEVPLEFPSKALIYEPSGMSKTIEDLLEDAGYEVALSRIGPNNWEVKRGSAKINVSYYEKTGLIIGDAYLCRLPQIDSKPLYEYLLKQNYQTQGLTFSIKGRDIVLSLLIYDRYLNVDTGKTLFQHLFERADYYDNILVEGYGASWIEQD